MSKGAKITGDGNGYNYQLPALIPILPQKITFTGTAAPSNEFHPNTTCIRVFPTQDCYLNFGTNPTASTSDIFCPGGVIQYFGVPPESNYLVSVIQSTTTGTLHIYEGR